MNSAPRLFSAFAIGLAVMSLAPVLIGLRITLHEWAIRDEAPVARFPLEGPYTQAELDSAGAMLRVHFPASQPAGEHSIDQVHAAAETERRLERARLRVDRERHEKALSEAGEQRPGGIVLLALGVVLVVLFTTLAWRTRDTSQSPE